MKVTIDFDTRMNEDNNKFLVKAKEIKTHRWVYGFFIPADNNRGYIFGSCLDDGEVFEVDVDTACRCTGLRSRDDDYVFENDIVILRIKSDSKNEPMFMVGRVVFDDYMWVIKSIKDEKLLYCFSSIDRYNKEWNVEIIGNYFDWIH